VAKPEKFNYNCHEWAIAMNQCIAKAKADHEQVKKDHAKAREEQEKVKRELQKVKHLQDQFRINQANASAVSPQE
jgi:hypothetical protein